MKINPIIHCKGLNTVKNAAKRIKQSVKSEKYKTNKKTFFAIPAVILAGSALALYAVQTADTKKNNIQITIPYNSDENKSKNTEQINKFSELKIPKSYDYLGDEISILQLRLYSTDLTPEERTLTENRIDLLLTKQQEQHNVADVFTDGTDLYITINIKNENLSEKLKDKYQFGINIESLKKLFDIKDGAIEENNDISSKWIPTSNDGKTGYYDYTLNWFKNGDVIKVPLTSINTDDINLSAYSK